MPEQEIAGGPIGQVGEFKVSLKDGKLAFELDLGPKVIIDALAAKIGGPIPAAIAEFIEKAFGLA